MGLSGDNMADDGEGKTLKDIAEERGIELNEVDLDAPPEIPMDTLWWSDESFEKEEGYDILAVWPQILAEKDDVENIQDFMSNMSCRNRVKIVGCVKTLPNYEHRNDENPETGGRVDLVFYFHNEDIYRVAVRRLQHGIRWWEDVVMNELEHGLSQGIIYEDYTIYPEDFRAFAGDGGYNTAKTVEEWQAEREEE